MTNFTPLKIGHILIKTIIQNFLRKFVVVLLNRKTDVDTLRQQLIDCCCFIKQENRC